MGFRDFIDPYLKLRSLMVTLKRNDYAKLQMIADDLNEYSEEFEFTPEILAARVIKTFIDEAYSDTTKQIVEAVLPEATVRRIQKRATRK